MVMEMQAKLERIRTEMEQMGRELERRERDGGNQRSDILPLRSTRLPWQG